MLTGNEPSTGFHISGDKSKGWDDETVIGLTIRQQFAAMAMQGLMSKQIPPNWNKMEVRLSWVEWVAELSCEMADQLIAELNKQ